MATALIAVVVRLARRDGASLRAHPTRVLGAAREGVPLLLRTLSLRGVLLTTTWVAAGLGVVSLAAYQVSSTIWTTLTFALDALAIAGQALTGRYLGAGDAVGARAATRLMLWWGVGGGAVLGLGVLALHDRPAARLHHRPARAGRAGRRARRGRDRAAAVRLGLRPRRRADRCRRRALAGRDAAGPAARPTCRSPSSSARTRSDVATLWWAFTLWMLLRGAALGWRVRSDAWLVTGATR